MTIFVKPDGGGHWYTADGVPQYEATLREARKENLYPSPTSILNIMHSSGLERWKLNQTISAAIELPRGAAEAEEAYGSRIAERADALRNQAAELGTLVHDGIEKMISGRLYDEGHPVLAKFSEWSAQNIKAHEWTERVLVNHKLGVAGKADAMVYFKGKAAEITGDKPCLVDWKTQRMKMSRAKKPVYKPVYYDKWVMQLAFYASCEMTPPPIVSVAINTSEPEEPYVKLWSLKEREEAMAAFEAALRLWQYEKNYKPELNRI